MSDETKPEVRLSAADIKKQIQEATKAAKAKTDVIESGMPITGMLANEINASESIPATPTKDEIKPQPETPAAKRVEAPNTTGESAVDLKEWARKKGIDWTTEESVISALHKSDQAFHAKREAERARAVPQSAQPTYQQPQPNAYPSNGNARPAYVPAQPDRHVIENIARDYNMTLEDAERLLKFNGDFFNVAMRGEREKWEREMASVRIENQKNSVFRDLSSDPVFRKPEVGAEYHKVLEEMHGQDPQSFEQDPNVYRRAYDRALVNIARRNLEGQPLQEGVPPVARNIPTTPPRPLGNGNGGGSLENENAIDPQTFAKLPVEEKRAYLEKRGLISTY